MSIVTIDFEASCLPRHGQSYPIEVGLADGGRAWSWLIRPHPDWAGWDWTDEAQALHGLTHDRIMRDGMAADAVLAALVQAVAGRRVIADSMIDQYWLDTLAAAAGVSAPFAIDHVAIMLEERRIDEQRIAAALAFADARQPVRHRAASDALWLHIVLDHALMAPVDAGAMLLPAE